MALGLSKARQDNRGSRRGGGTGGGGQENVAILVAQVHPADPAKKVANPDEDYAIGYLLHDAFGKKAEFNEDGGPTTEVRFKVPKREQKGEFAPREVIDLLPNRRKGSSPLMGEWPVVVLERARIGRDGETIEAGWLNVAKYSDSDPMNEVFTTGVKGQDSLEQAYDVYATVFREQSRDGRERQQRVIIAPETAQTFDSVDDFKAKVAALLEETQYDNGFNHSVIVRIYDRRIGLPADQMNLAEGETVESVNNEFIDGVVYRRWDKAANAKVSTTAAVDEFFADEAGRNADLIAALAAAGTPDAEGYVFEVIQQREISTGVMSLPSRKKGKDDAEHFRMPFKDDETNDWVRNNSGALVTRQGFSPAIFLVQRSNPESHWFATQTYRRNRRHPIFERYEIPTDNMPANVRDYFVARGTERAQKMIEEFANARQATAAPDEDTPEDTIGFGEPDHSAGGLTPAR